MRDRFVRFTVRYRSLFLLALFVIGVIFPKRWGSSF